MIQYCVDCQSHKFKIFLARQIQNSRSDFEHGFINIMDQRKIYSFACIIAPLSGFPFLSSQHLLGCTSFGPPRQERHWYAGPVEQRVPKVFRAGALALWGEDAGAGLIQPGEEMALVGAHSSPQRPQGRDWGVGARLFTAVLGEKKWDYGQKLREERFRLQIRRSFPPGDSWAGVWVVQGGLASSILGSFQALTGHSPEQPGLNLELVLPEWEAVLETPWPPFPPGLSYDAVLATVRRRLHTHIDMHGSEPNHTARSCVSLFLGESRWNSNITQVKSKIPSDFWQDITPCILSLNMEKEYGSFATSFRHIMSHQMNKAVQPCADQGAWASWNLHLALS